MNIFAWIIFGALAGWLASKLVGEDAKMGAFANIIVGIIGAAVGGFIFQGLTGDDFSAEFNLSSLAIAIVGSVVFLGILKLVRGKK